MNNAHAQRNCPAMAALVEWFDGSLAPDAADATERHLTDCSRCRQMLLDWSERVGATALDAIPGECPDTETLVAYCAAALDATAAAEVERHLRRCARCVPALQHIMVLQRQMEPAAEAASTAAVLVRAAGESNSPAESREKSSEDDSRETVGVGLSRLGSTQPGNSTPWRRYMGARADLFRGWAVRWRLWWQRLGPLLTSASWPRAALATAAALVLAIGITRFVLPSGQIQEMRGRSGEHVVAIEITADTVGRARPALDEPVVERIARGTQAQWLETSGEWTRIELADGRRVWVENNTVGQIREE
jgi:anti-sigma factor RsiW